MACPSLSITDINNMIVGSNSVKRTEQPWGTDYIASLKNIKYSEGTGDYPTNGILNDKSQLNQTSPVDVTTLPTFPDPTNYSPSEYSEKLQSYISQLNDEYCLYYNIYKFSIQCLLDDIISLNGKTWADVEIRFPGTSSETCYTDVTPNNDCYDILSAFKKDPNNLLSVDVKNICTNKQTKNTICQNIISGNIQDNVTGKINNIDINISAEKTDVLIMNIRCLQLLKYMMFVKEKLNDNTTTYLQTINGKIATITGVTNQLQDQNNILNDTNMNNDVYQRMVEYTNEKNKYSSNLLALYGGLNIIAITLLVYIYRS